MILFIAVWYTVGCGIVTVLSRVAMLRLSGCRVVEMVSGAELWALPRRDQRHAIAFPQSPPIGARFYR
jgi:hypothetical protein